MASLAQTKEGNVGDTPFIKFYPSDFLGGTSGLSPAERGTYITLLCLIYEAGGPIPRDDARLSRRCGAPKAAFKRMLGALLDEGKLTEQGGMLSNRRAEKALVDRANRTQNATHAASSRWSAQAGKNKQNQRPDNAGAMPGQCVGDASQKPEARVEEDSYESLSVSTDPKPHSDVSEAVAVYNEAAGEVGWPKVQKLTPNRSKLLKARMGESGGLDGWRAAIDKAKASDFLCARTEKPWTGCGFDWLTKQANFTKLMEGNYDNRDHHAGHSATDARDRERAFAVGAVRTPRADIF